MAIDGWRLIVGKMQKFAGFIGNVNGITLHHATLTTAGESAFGAWRENFKPS